LIKKNDIKGREKAEHLINKTYKTMAGIYPLKKSTQLCIELKDEIKNEKKAKEKLRQELK
jgi:hypothetical protein